MCNSTYFYQKEMYKGRDVTKQYCRWECDVIAMATVIYNTVAPLIFHTLKKYKNSWAYEKLEVNKSSQFSGV